MGNIWKRLLLISPIFPFYHIANTYRMCIYLATRSSWWSQPGLHTRLHVQLLSYHKNSILRSVLMVDLNAHSSFELAMISFLPTINLVFQPLKNPQDHELYFKLINGTKLHIPVEYQSLTCSYSFLLLFLNNHCNGSKAALEQ